jgi:hypothetical protein
MLQRLVIVVLTLVLAIRPGFPESDRGGGRGENGGGRGGGADGGKGDEKGGGQGESNKGGGSKGGGDNGKDGGKRGGRENGDDGRGRGEAARSSARGEAGTSSGPGGFGSGSSRSGAASVGTSNVGSGGGVAGTSGAGSLGVSLSPGAFGGGAASRGYPGAAGGRGTPTAGQSPTGLSSTTGSVLHPVEDGSRGADDSLPPSLRPVFLGEVFVRPERPRAPGMLPVRPGTPAGMVQACRARIGQAGQRYGAVRVEAVSAGPPRLQRNGVRVAPINVRIVYERGGRVQVRQSAAMCHVNVAGRVTAIR